MPKKKFKVQIVNSSILEHKCTYQMLYSKKNYLSYDCCNFLFLVTQADMAVFVVKGSVYGLGFALMMMKQPCPIIRFDQSYE